MKQYSGYIADIKKISARIGKWAVYALAGIFLITSLLFIALQTDTVSAWLIGILNRSSSGENGAGIEVKDIKGVLPFNFVIGDLSVYDRDGEWLKIHDCSVKLAPLDLLKGRFYFEKLYLSRTQIDRLPSKNKGTPRRLPGGFRLPAFLSRITVRDIQAPVIDMDSGILGVPAQFRLMGGVSDTGSGTSRDYSLEIASTDGNTDLLQVSVRIGINPAQTELRIDASEPGKGILYQLTGLGEDFRCLVEGSGDLSGWKGNLHACSRETGELTSKISIKDLKDIQINLSGSFLFADGLLNEKYRDITGKGADFKIDADLIGQEAVRFNLLEVKTGRLEAGFRGKIRLSDLVSEGAFSVKIKDTASPDKFIAGYSLGSLSVEGIMKGKLFRPDIDVSYSIAGLGSDRFDISEINGTGQGSFAKKDDSEEIMSVSGDGNIEGFFLKSGDREYREEKISCRFELTHSNGGQINVKLFNAASPGVEVYASGYLDTADKHAGLDGRLVITDISRLYPEAADLMKGKGNIGFTLDADLISDSFKGFLKGSFAPLWYNQDLKRLVGDTVGFEGRVNLADKVIGVSEMKIRSSSATLEGSGTYDPKGFMASGFTLVIPDISAASALIDNSIGGMATIDCSLKGELNRLELTSGTEIRDFSWNEHRIGNLSGKINGTHKGSNNNGKIALEFFTGDQRIKAGSDFHTSGKGVSLRNFHLSGMETEMAGNITWNRNENLINGKLDLSSTDISKIVSLYGGDMKGSLSAEVAFKPDKKMQGLDVSASAKKISFNRNIIENISGRCSMEDIFGALDFTASASVKGFNRDGIILETVDLKGQGQRSNAEFNFKGSGMAGEKLEFETSVLFTGQGENRAVNIKKLEGRFGGSQAKILQPLTVDYSADRMKIDNFNINVDSGNIRGSLDYASEKLNGSLVAGDIPLSLLSLAGGPVLDGTLEGSVKLDGSPESPDISGNVTASGIRRKTLKLNRIPPFTIKTEYEFKRDIASANFILDGLSESSFRGSIEVPCSFSIHPFTLVFNNTEPLKGSIKGEFDLSAIPAVFELHDQIITGRLNTGFDIGGNYRAPSITGKAVLLKGTYENTGMGVMLENIGAEISAENTGLRLYNFKADDGLKGRVTGKGHLDLDAAADFPYKLDMDLNSMQVAGNDRLRAVVGGNAVISGNMKQHNLSGKLVVEKADFEIAEKLPVEIAEVEIKEINIKSETVRDEQKEQPQKSNIRFDMAVSSPGRVYIKGRGLDSEWKGDVKLEGTSDNPVITGRLSLVRGNYNFLARPFTLTDGQVTFFGNSPPDPYFDITGKSVNSSITALINLKGNIKKPELTLSSDPVLPQDEILARVLFGREISQITPFQALQLAAALNEMLGRKKGFDPLAYTRNLIGVDRLEVKQSQTNPDESALSAGKYLKDNIYIEVEKGISAESGKASVTWELTPNITVETDVGENSETGMGINWKYDY